MAICKKCQLTTKTTINLDMQGGGEIKHTAIENLDKICLGTKISVMAWDDEATKNCT